FTQRAFDVPVVIMAGAALNALLVTIIASMNADSGASLTFGISPFQLVALLVAVKLSLGAGTQHKAAPIWFDAIVLALILVPSSAVSWGALALYAAFQATQTTAERRIGALVFLGVALASIWSSVILKWIALPVTTAEAFVLAKMLSLFRPDIAQFGNVVGNPETHNLILMTKCTTTDALPHAAVALVAVAYLLGDVKAARLWRAVLALGAIYAVANLIRLAIMAWSSDAYDLAHGPIGANIFDMFQAATVLLLGNWASQP
ncbi:MAG: hypothetical protein ACK5KM_15130, partial [Hyphomicrobiaceae bacterium]